MNRHLLFASLAVTATVGVHADLSGTNGAIQRATASVAAATARAQADPTHPIYHVTPPAFWNNDPNGPIYSKGWYHLFYQHNPYGDDWGNMHWGHVRSRDLAHWEHVPIALWPSKELGEDHVFSGCAVLAEGQPMIFYTSIGRGKDAGIHAEQWAALGSEDLLTWRKHPANPILTEALHGDVKVYDWRDPFHFEHAGRHYLVLGGNLNQAKGGQAVVLLYEALNGELTKWSYRGILFRHPDPQVKDIECPNFFRLGGKWVLLVSPYGRVQYFVGDFDAAKGEFVFRTQGLLDQSDQFYAPNTLLNRGDRRLLWGWIRGFKPGMGWNGCLTLPRDLALDPQGRLEQRPVRELRRLRGRGVRLPGFSLEDSTRTVAAGFGDSVEVTAEFQRGSASEFGLRFVPSVQTQPAVEISADGRGLNLAGLGVAISGASAPIRLTVFADRSVLEVFVDGLCVASRVIEAPGPQADLQVFARGGTVTVGGLSVWKLKSAWRPGS
jgi:sucrose-6-phosphate hydrolase SacC (GH32 family)